MFFKTKKTGYSLIEIIIVVGLIAILAVTVRLYSGGKRTLAEVVAVNISIETARTSALNYISQNSTAGKYGLIQLWDNDNIPEILDNLSDNERKHFVVAYAYGAFWIGYHLNHADNPYVLPEENREWLRTFLNKNRSVYGSATADLSARNGAGKNTPAGLLDNTWLRENIGISSYGGIDSNIFVIDYLWVKLM